MKFFLGTHHPSDAGKISRAFVSVHRLEKRKSGFPVNEWILDSGAFSTIKKYGGYPEPVSAYARYIRQFSTCGNLLAAVSQDYMCEPIMLARTGLSVADHQRLTIERYDALMAEDCAGVPIMPVLQGYAPEDYLIHLCDYGSRLTPGMYVGVGSVCKRNANASTIEGVLQGIKFWRPDLRLHGFGIKISALTSKTVQTLLESADSMAWSFAARYAGRDANDINEGIAYAARVEALLKQLDCQRRGCNRSGIRASTTLAAKDAHSLPITCPGMKANEPKANPRNNALSTTEPTNPADINAIVRPCCRKGV